MADSVVNPFSLLPALLPLLRICSISTNLTNSYSISEAFSHHSLTIGTVKLWCYPHPTKEQIQSGFICSGNCIGLAQLEKTSTVKCNSKHFALIKYCALPSFCEACWYFGRFRSWWCNRVIQYIIMGLVGTICSHSSVNALFVSVGVSQIQHYASCHGNMKYTFRRN